MPSSSFERTATRTTGRLVTLQNSVSIPGNFEASKSDNMDPCPDGGIFVDARTYCASTFSKVPLLVLPRGLRLASIRRSRSRFRIDRFGPGSKKGSDDNDSHLNEQVGSKINDPTQTAPLRTWFRPILCPKSSVSGSETDL
jgi:hypothetical protein